MYNVEIWNNLGHAYTNKALIMNINSDEEYKEGINVLEIAIEKYQNALHCNPKNLEAWYNIGHNYYFIERYEKSINAYKEALKLDPEDFKIWCDLAEAYAMAEKRHEQHHALLKALEINSKDHNIWRRLGFFYYYVNKNYNKAIEALNESLKLDSNRGHTWALLGHVYREMGENKRAIKLYKKALEIDPNISIWNRLGSSYWAIHDFDNAIKAFEQSLKSYYKNIAVWNNLVRIYLKLKNYNKVIELCENIFKIKWDTRDIIYKNQIPKTYDLLSVAYKRTGKNIKSLEASNHAKELNQRINIKIESIEENQNLTNWKMVLNYSKKYSKKRIYEKQIEETIVKNPEILEDGLKLIGRQYKTSVGFIDILFKDQEDSFVVVELKRGKGRDKVVGQIQRYMVWVNENLSQAKSVRGIIVVKEVDKKLDYAIKGSKFPIEIITFKNEPPHKNNIKYCDECGAVNRKSAKFCQRCQNKFWMK